MDHDSQPPGPCDFERCDRERRLYMNLLEIAAMRGHGTQLQECLNLAVEATRARAGYLAFRPLSDDSRGPRWSCHVDLHADRLHDVTHLVSSGIIEHAMRGNIVHTTFAMLDFPESRSARANALEAVICVPLGDLEVSGVLYLEGAARQAFSDEDVRLAQTFARYVTPTLERLAREAQRSPIDAELEGLRSLGIIATSPVMAKVYREVQVASYGDITTLIIGPAGTGKTAIARALHHHSSRAGGPFVVQNCANLPSGLFESELFGTQAGAFTGAINRSGVVQQAEGGTLLLDEVGELPMESQSKLLRFLDTSPSRFRVVGASTESTCDVRFIAATNKPLPEMVAAGTFRQDLYYRLRQLQIVMPDLDERREDIIPIAEHVLQAYAHKRRKRTRPLAPSARAALESAEWPGQVRELTNTIEAGVLRAEVEGAVSIEARHLFPEHPAPPNTPRTYQAALRQWQREFLGEQLARHEHKVPETAKDLDMSKANLYLLIKSLEIERPD